jgi:hypothetical protein
MQSILKRVFDMIYEFSENQLNWWRYEKNIKKDIPGPILQFPTVFHEGKTDLSIRKLRQLHSNGLQQKKNTYISSISSRLSIDSPALFSQFLDRIGQSQKYKKILFLIFCFDTVPTKTNL